MPQCTKKHYNTAHKGKPSQIPCYYIAGVCVTDPMHQGSMEMFLRSTYPYFHGSTYERSKQMQRDHLPLNLPIAHTNDKERVANEQED